MNALLFCRGLGSSAEMAKVKDGAQLKLLSQVIDEAKGSKYEYFWIGGNDIAAEGNRDCWLHDECLRPSSG